MVRFWLRVGGVGVVVLGVVGFWVSVACASQAGRVFEQVSPVFKGGYGAGVIEGVDSSVVGGWVVFSSQGAFAGVPANMVGDHYEAVRGVGGGWSTVSLMPPAWLSPFPLQAGFSSSLDGSLWQLVPGGNAGQGNSEPRERQFVEHLAGMPDDASGFVPVGPPLRRVDGEPFNLDEEGLSDNFCTVLVGHVQALLAEAVGIPVQIYEVSKGCGGGAPALKLLALDNEGKLISSCRPDPGSDIYRYNALSADGSTVFFRVQFAKGEECQANAQLFVRLNGERTIEVSRPLGTGVAGGCVSENGGVAGEVPCQGALSRPESEFVGASQDGSRVFFLTKAGLVGSDVDGGEDLYVAGIGCPESAPGCASAGREVVSLTQVSHDANPGEAADVQGVVRVAPDGSRVYFVARGVLTGQANGLGQTPVLGADNLYVYDVVTGTTGFVGELCSGPGSSGVVGDLGCPSDLSGATKQGFVVRNDTGLWERFPVAQTAGSDGRYLVFSTYARLIGSGTEKDTDDAQDVYRFDAVTGGLTRVSVGENGFDANGNEEDTRIIGENVLENADARVQPAELGNVNEEREIVRQASSADGSRIVFTSAGRLSPVASNGVSDVYEWHDGVVSLISSGSSVEADELPVITPSGQDVFFRSAQGLVTGDTDGAPDIYDARIGGIRPEPPAEPKPCSGDACQGPLSAPAPALIPGSVTQPPGENAKPVRSKTVKHKKRARTGHAKHHRRARKRGHGAKGGRS